MVRPVAAFGIRTLADWAEFYRTYLAITQWLIGKGQYSAFDQSQRALRMLDPGVRAIVDQWLMIKNPNQAIDDPYTLADINEAAQ